MARPPFVRIDSARTLFLTDEGYEALSSIPMAPPVGFTKEEPLHLRIKRMVREARLQEELDAAGHETFEEADDFDVGDDYDPSSPFEIEFDPPEVLQMFQHAEQEAYAARGEPNPPADGPKPSTRKASKLPSPSSSSSPQDSEPED